jgi:hypothetical protein
MKQNSSTCLFPLPYSRFVSLCSSLPNNVIIVLVISPFPEQYFNCLFYYTHFIMFTCFSPHSFPVFVLFLVLVVVDLHSYLIVPIPSNHLVLKVSSHCHLFDFYHSCPCFLNDNPYVLYFVLVSIILRIMTVERNIFTYEFSWIKSR